MNTALVMYSIPSSRSGIISVPASLRESLSCLDIVWSDMFETEDINPEEAQKHEADFLKGAPLQWINLAEKENSPLVKRDGFADLRQLIKRKNRKRCLVTDVSLRYQPGSGGSTLAMQVLWDFRKDLRCARVIDSDLDTKELSKQAVDLFLLSSEEHAKQDRKTVLLLLDTKEKINDQPIKNILWEDLIEEIHKRGIDTDTPVVIILNCIPTDFTLTDTMILTPKLSMKTFKEQLLQQIRLQRKGSWKVTTISLLHHKDSSGSALAREVLSDLSEEFTCETWTEPFKTDITGNKESLRREIENMANELHTLYEKHQNTVLLLLDHEDDKPQPNYLKNLLSKLQRADQADHPAFIVINAVSKSAVRAKDDVKLKMELLPEEKERFAQKRLEIEQKKLSQTFHAFNIMRGGFQKEDAKKLMTEEMVTYVKNHKESGSTRLLSFLALINSYVPGSHLSKLFCQEFMDQTDEENTTLETKMTPFMHLIVIFSKGEKDPCIRLAHPMIADACLKMFTESKLMRFDIALDFLNSLVKGKESSYEQICRRMLVVRLEILMEKKKFSRLILDIKRENNADQCIRLLEVASGLFKTDPFYPQALARLFYIEVKEDNKYEEARKWAEKAIERDSSNSHIRDTLGQVHKNHLLNETKKPSPDIKVCLPIAQSAIKAFKDEETAAEDESGDDTKFNNRGLFGFLQVCKIIHPQMPLEHSEKEYVNGLKGDVETKYDFFEWFLAFSRQSFEKEDPDYIHKDVEKCYKRHFEMDKQTDKITLGEKKKYSGELLHILKSDISVLKQYKSKTENPQSDSETQTVLYILANIICSESGEQFQKIKEYQSSLQKLWLREMQDKRPEFYLLILLLFWPEDMQRRITNPPNLEKCLRKMRHSYKTNYQKYLHSRYLVPLFFFGKGKGLQKLIHTSKLRQTDLELLTEGDGNVKIKDLQRISGQVRKHKVFAIRGEKEIQVAPHDRASVCKQGQVSFYLGFNIRGPVAYNISYIDTSGDYYMKTVNKTIKKN